MIMGSLDTTTPAATLLGDEAGGHGGVYAMLAACLTKKGFIAGALERAPAVAEA